MRLMLGPLEYGVYLAYTIWLVEHRFTVTVLTYDPDWNSYAINFKDETDALAFKLRFGL